MSGKAKALGGFLILAAFVCIAVNLGIYHPFPLTLLPGWFWNPLSLLTSRIVGNVPLISGSIGWLVNGVFSVIYSAVLFVIGVFLVLKS